MATLAPSGDRSKTELNVPLRLNHTQIIDVAS
jgi:hypothetical protein